MADQPKTQTTHVICGTCGGSDVRADAWASWDTEKGDWVLHSTYDHRYCENCDGEVRLIEVDEAAELEIGFYGMVNVNKDGEARLVQDDETPDFFDIMVRTTNIEGGEIFTLFEVDDLNREQADSHMQHLTAKFPQAPIDWHLGKA